MANFKNEIKTIFQILIFGFIYLSVSNSNNLIFSTVFLLLWICSLIYNLYLRFQYKKGKADYIHFPTVNDSYTKITSITLGLIFFFLSISLVVWVIDFRFYGEIGLLVSSLIFCEGVFDLPNGKLRIEGFKMSISGINEKIDIRQVKEIIIFKDRIDVMNIYNEKKRLEYLEIDETFAIIISNYLFQKCIEQDLKIINNVGE